MKNADSKNKVISIDLSVCDKQDFEESLEYRFFLYTYLFKQLEEVLAFLSPMLVTQIIKKEIDNKTQNKEDKNDK